MANNGKGDKEIDQMIARLKTLPGAMLSVVPQVSDVLRDFIAADITAQRAPDGAGWAPGIKGQPVLTGAMGAVTVGPVGPVAIATVRGIEAKHHYGYVKGRKARPIIPEKLPAALVPKIKAILAKEFTGHIKGDK